MAVPCPEPAAPSSNHGDDMTEALDVMYGLYGKCAGIHMDLINWLATEQARR